MSAIVHTSDAENIKSNLLMEKVVWQIDTIPDRNVTESIVALAKAYGDSVVIRMAPKSYSIWESVRRNGFVIKRGTGVNDLKEISAVLPVAESMTKSNAFIKDSFAVAAAFILYGNIDKSSVSGLYSLYEANENILGTSLLLAEFSTAAANTFGFRFVDKDVKPGQNYYYEISTKDFNSPENTALIHVLNEKRPFRMPYEFNVIPGDGAMVLDWSLDYNKGNFTHYKIERSTDGKKFLPLTERPLIFSETNGYNRTNFSYTDSFNIINNSKYYYKLYGYDSFSDVSPAASASGTPRDLTPPVPPKLDKVDFNDQTYQFAIEWEIDIEKVEADLAYYQVMVARDQQGTYSAVSPKLGVSDFNYTYDLGTVWTEEMEGRYYFRIDCYDESGNVSQSDFETSFVPDYTNPSAPDSISGYVDSLSFVHLSWFKSASKDVRGYWLYWGNSLNEELALVSKDIIADTSYQYYIPEKSLKKHLYYVVRAEDHAFNRSESTLPVLVKLLDKIPPTRPSIKSINTDSLTLRLNIGLSSSDDVRYHELYRREALSKDTAWVLLDTLDTEVTYTDTAAGLDVLYQYRVRAIDFAGNKSIFSPLKSGILKVTGDQTKVNNFIVKQKPKSPQVEMSWQVSIPAKLKKETYSIDVYRSTGQDGVKFYKNLAAGQESYLEQNLEAGVLYNYALRVKYDNGLTGGLSEVKSIIIK